MFFSVVAVVICGVAGFQAHKGTTNMAAKLAVYGLLSCILILVLA